MLKAVKKVITSHITFFIIITAIILSLNLTPLVMHVRHSPPGRTFALIHNNVQDFFFYQSLMSEGARGQWLTTDPYTTEPGKPSIVFAYFVWMGKISRLLGLKYDVTYHAVRIFAGILLFAAAYHLIRTLRLPYPRLTFFFFVFATPLLRKIPDAGKLIDVPYMNWWTGMDAIRRAAYLPHHVFGGFLTVMTVLFLIRYSRTLETKYTVFAVLFSAILAFILTPGLMIILLCLPATVVILWLVHDIPGRKLDPVVWFKKHSKLLAGLFLFWTAGAAFLVIMVSQTRLGFPWSQYIAWEKNLQFTSLKTEIYGALGILIPFALIGTAYSVMSKKFENIFIVCWLFLPLLIIPFALALGISNARLIQGVPYLPLAILAVIGISSIGDLISRINIKKRLPPAIIHHSLFIIRFLNRQPAILRFIHKHTSIRTNMFPFISLIIFLIYSVPTHMWSLKDQIREYWPIFGNVYLDDRLFVSYDFIDKNYPKNTIVLSSFYSGNMIPAYTHAISFIGHFGYTFDNDRKSKEVVQFFSNKMTEKEAKEFLLKNKIDLVYQSPEEKPLYNNYLYPKILKVVYDWGDVTIYTLK